MKPRNVGETYNVKLIKRRGNRLSKKTFESLETKYGQTCRLET